MNRKTLLIGVTAAVVVAGGGFITAEPANAGQYSVTSNDAEAVPHVRHGFITGRTRFMQAHSDEFWASVTGTWVVPHVTCSKTQNSTTSMGRSGRLGVPHRRTDRHRPELH